MEMFVSECDTDIKMEMEDNGVDTVLQRIIDDIKLLRLRLTATHSYVEMLQKQLNEAMDLKQELSKQLNRLLDNEVSIRNIIQLNKASQMENQLSPVVNLSDQQTSESHECLSNIVDVSKLVKKLKAHESANNIPTVEEELKKQVVNRVALVNQNQDHSNLTSFTTNVLICNENANVCVKTFDVLACDEIVDSSVTWSTIQAPSNSSLRQCQTRRSQNARLSAIAPKNVNVLSQPVTTDVVNVTDIPLAKTQLSTFLHQCPSCRLCYQSKKSLQVHLKKKPCKQVCKTDVCKIIQQNIMSCFSCGRTDISECSKYYYYDNVQICLDCEKFILDPTIQDSSESTEYSQPSHAKKGFTCLKCKKEFALVNNIIAHLRYHTGYRPHICYRCGMTFTLASGVSSHIRLSHDQIKSSFKCDVCSKQLINDYQLKIHLLTHSSEKAFVCSVCGVAYAFEYRLRIHMRNHTGIRPYACSKCPKTFTMKSHLNNHTASNHSEKKPVECPVCLKTLNSKRFLRRHHREVHLGVPRKH